MPRKDGREALAAINANDSTRSIPVVIRTTSESAQDVAKSYDLQDSCYITKPVDLAQFTTVVQRVQESRLCLIKYPSATR